MKKFNYVLVVALGLLFLGWSSGCVNSAHKGSMTKKEVVPKVEDEKTEQEIQAEEEMTLARQARQQAELKVWQEKEKDVIVSCYKAEVHRKKNSVSVGDRFCISGPSSEFGKPYFVEGFGPESGEVQTCELSGTTLVEVIDIDSKVGATAKVVSENLKFFSKEVNSCCGKDFVFVEGTQFFYMASSDIGYKARAVILHRARIKKAREYAK